MEVRLLRHAVHPQLIGFPLGLLTAAVGFDLLWYVNGREAFATTAGYLTVAGVLTGLPTALFGLVDWTNVPRHTRARRLGALHGWGNLVMLGLFALSLPVRLASGGWETEPLAFVLALLGLALSGVTGWMGGELVERHAVSVHRGAHPDAPSSLISPNADSTPRPTAEAGPDVVT
jgi:uncharacterized membrane protein